MYCRVSGSTGQEPPLADQEMALRERATGTVYRAYQHRGSGLRERLERAQRDDAATRQFAVVPVVAGSVGAGFGVAWIERDVSVVGVRVETVGGDGDTVSGGGADGSRSWR